MKNYIILLLVFCCSASVRAQGAVDWKVFYQPDSSRLVFEAKIADGWHLYSQFTPNDVGPIPTTFSFVKNEQIELLNGVIEPTPIQKYEEVFEADLSYFIQTVQFFQNIKAKKSTQMEGVITYMICNDSQCLPPTDYPFIVLIP